MTDRTYQTPLRSPSKAMMSAVWQLFDKTYFRIVPLELENAERLQPLVDAPLVICQKHQYNADVPALYVSLMKSVGKGARFVMRASLPVWLQYLGGIPVMRNRPTTDLRRLVSLVSATAGQSPAQRSCSRLFGLAKNSLFLGTPVISANDLETMVGECASGKKPSKVAREYSEQLNQRAYQEIVQALDNREFVVFYPESTRHPNEIGTLDNFTLQSIVSLKERTALPLTYLCVDTHYRSSRCPESPQSSILLRFGEPFTLGSSSIEELAGHITKDIDLVRFEK